jgi:hypothetical protein
MYGGHEPKCKLAALIIDAKAINELAEKYHGQTVLEDVR